MFLSESKIHSRTLFFMGLREKNRLLGDQDGRLWDVFVSRLGNEGQDVIGRYAEMGSDVVTKHAFQRLSPVIGSLKREKPVVIKAMHGKEGDKRTWTIRVPLYTCFNCSKNNEQECVDLGNRGLAKKVGKFWATPHLNDVAPMGHFQEIILGHAPKFKLNGTKEVYRCTVCGLPKAVKSYEVKVKTFMRKDCDTVWVATFRIHGEVAKALLYKMGWNDKIWTNTPYYGQEKGLVAVAEWHRNGKKVNFSLAD
jgi:DNA-directed RNA polymerase subunit RPC12/RpoP